MQQNTLDVVVALSEALSLIVAELSMRVGSVLVLTTMLSLAIAAPTVRLGGTMFLGRENFVNGLPLQEFFGGEYNPLNGACPCNLTSAILGIPFAQAPTAELRFAPPVPLRTPGVSIFDASSYSLPCPQVGVSYWPSYSEF